MRTSRQRIWLVRAGAVLGGLGILTSTPCFALSDSTTAAPSAVASNPQVSFSPGMRDVQKLLDAKVDSSVIRAYISNSPTPFNPNASEIIALKQRGVPDEIITSLMQRGAEVRTQMAQAALQAGSGAMAPNAPAEYPYDYGNSTPYYPYDYSDSGYGYPYFGYPYNYWWYNSYYPWSFYSPFFFNSYFHHGFDRFHRFNGGFHRFDGFHGNRSFAFQGRSGFGARSGAWAARTGPGFRPFAARSSGFGGGSFASRPGGFGGHTGGFAGHAGGFAGHSGGFAGHGGGGGGGHGGGHR